MSKQLRFYRETGTGLEEIEMAGIEMGKGFMSAIGVSAPLKDYVTNSNDMRAGVQYCQFTPKQDERQLTLTFYIKGSTQEEYETNKNAFYAMLYGGDVILAVPSRRSEVYRLKYKSGVSYDETRNGCFSQYAAKFTEPDPTNRAGLPV
jgi:hypothetical protein